MSFDFLRGYLRLLFWILTYLGILCGALLAFAASPYRWAAWVAILTIIIHDAHRRFPQERPG